MKYSKLIEIVFEEIDVDEEFFLKQTKEFVKELKKIFPRNNIIIGGSLAKKTMIKKEKQDIDLFICFNKEDEMKIIEEKFEDKKINYKKIHGSRDYFQIEKGSIVFEIVPILKIKKLEEVKNTTDFSPLHVKYILSQIKKRPFLRKEIKLTKAFCLANEFYGAESYIQGFSGYALEVLVCYYGSFLNFLKNFGKRKVIDPGKYFKNEKEVLRELNQSKIFSPIVLIDPVYKYRNLCANLSEENFKKFLLKAREFLKNPSVDFFKKKEFNFKEFKENSKKRNEALVVIDLVCSNEKEDISAVKMKKFFNYLKEELKRKQQFISDSKFLYLGNKRAKAFLSLKINKRIKVFGPKKDMKKALEEFIKKREEIYFENDVAYSYEDFSLEKFFKKQKEVAKSMDVEFKLVEDI